MSRKPSKNAVTDNNRRRAGRPRKNASLPDPRQRILDAAAGVFSEQGYEAASVDAIASRVGIRAPSLYHHFKNKNEILWAIMTQTRAMLLDGCHQAVDEAGTDPKDKLIAFIHTHVHAELDQGEIMPMIDSLTMRGERMARVLTEEQMRIVITCGQQSGITQLTWKRQILCDDWIP